MQRRLIALVGMFILAMLVFRTAPAAAQDTSTVTLFHFSDYHSHAVPFYSEGPRPVERALNLMGAIDAGLTPIIEAQREYMGDVRRDAQTVIDMVERQIDSTAARINPLLSALGLPPLVTPPKKPVSM